MRFLRKLQGSAEDHIAGGIHERGCRRPEVSIPYATSQPMASSGIHLTVTPFTRLNPRGVLPYAIGGPVFLALGIVLIYRRRRRNIDMGGSA